MTNPSSSYTPQPINKTRYTGQKSFHSPQKPSASIVIRMDAIEKASQKQTQEEAKVIEQIASFVPLSTTPAPQYASDDFGARDRIRDEVDSLDTQELPSSGYPRYKKETHMGLWLTLLGILVLIWGGLVSLRTGVDSFINSPIEATQFALSGQLTIQETQVNTPQIETRVVEDEGELEVHVSSISAHKKKAWVVRAEVYNGMSRTQTNIRLAMELELSTDPPLVQKYELACCKEWSLEDLEKSLPEILENHMSASPNVSIKPEEKSYLTWVVPMAKNSNLRISPDAKITVIFREHDE